MSPKSKLRTRNATWKYLINSTYPHSPHRLTREYGYYRSNACHHRQIYLFLTGQTISILQPESIPYLAFQITVVCSLELNAANPAFVECTSLRLKYMTGLIMHTLLQLSQWNSSWKNQLQTKQNSVKIFAGRCRQWEKR